MKSLIKFPMDCLFLLFLNPSPSRQNIEASFNEGLIKGILHQGLDWEKEKRAIVSLLSNYGGNWRSDNIKLMHFMGHKIFQSYPILTQCSIIKYSRFQDMHDDHRLIGERVLSQGEKEFAASFWNSIHFIAFWFINLINAIRLEMGGLHFTVVLPF